MATAVERQFTFEDAAALDAEMHAGEIAHGRWIPVTRNTWRHGHIVVRIGVLLHLYAKANPGWDVAAADPGTKLRRSPDVLRGPDVAIVRAERVPTGKGADGWLDGAPDVAVEIMGDGQSASSLARKALEYLGAGAKQVWVVDAEAASVMVYTPPDHVRVLGAVDVLDGGDALPGFSCGVAELFE